VGSVMALKVSEFPNENSSSNHVPRSFKKLRTAVTNCQELRRLLSSRCIAARDGYAYQTIHSLGWHIAPCVTIHGRLVFSQIFAGASA
jgi:hypothetical protein